MTTKPTNDRQYDRRTVLKRGGLYVGAVGAGVSFAPAKPARADDAPVQLENGVLADGFEGGDRMAFIGGMLRSALDRRRRPPQASILADRLRNEFNANSEMWLSYGNWLLDEHDVTVLGDTTVGVDVAVTSRVFDDDIVETSLEVGFDDSEERFEELAWIDDGPDDPEYQIRIEDYAAASGEIELYEFRQEFIGEDVDDHELPDEEYLSRLAGKYRSSIRFGDRERSVLELLLGEVSL